MISLRELLGLLTVSQNIIVEQEETQEILLNSSPIDLLYKDTDPNLDREVTHVSATEKNTILILLK